MINFIEDYCTMPATFQEIDIENDFKQIGKKSGSNEGGFFEKEDSHEKYYIKWMPKVYTDQFGNPPHKYNNRNINRFICEYLAGKFYELFHVKATKPSLIKFKRDGKEYIGILTPIENNIDQLFNIKDPEILKQVLHEAKADFLIDAWLGNYDVVGLVQDNLHYKKNKNFPFRLDAGGALFYSASGKPKKENFNELANEFEAMHSGEQCGTGLNEHVLKQASFVFGGVFSSFMLLTGLERFLYIGKDSIIDHIKTHGFDETTDKGLKKNQKLINLLLMRRENLIEKAIEKIAAQVDIYIQKYNSTKKFDVNALNRYQTTLGSILCLLKDEGNGKDEKIQNIVNQLAEIELKLNINSNIHIGFKRNTILKFLEEQLSKIENLKKTKLDNYAKDQSGKFTVKAKKDWEKELATCDYLIQALTSLKNDLPSKGNLVVKIKEVIAGQQNKSEYSLAKNNKSGFCRSTSKLARFVTELQIKAEEIQNTSNNNNESDKCCIM